MSTAITGVCGFKLVRVGLMANALFLPLTPKDACSFDEVPLGQTGVRGWRSWVLDPSLDRIRFVVASRVAFGCAFLFRANGELLGE